MDIGFDFLGYQYANASFDTESGEWGNPQFNSSWASDVTQMMHQDMADEQTKVKKMLDDIASRNPENAEAIRRKLEAGAGSAAGTAGGSEPGVQSSEPARRREEDDGGEGGTDGAYYNDDPLKGLTTDELFEKNALQEKYDSGNASKIGDTLLSGQTVNPMTGMFGGTINVSDIFLSPQRVHYAINIQNTGTAHIAFDGKVIETGTGSTTLIDGVVRGIWEENGKVYYLYVFLYVMSNRRKAPKMNVPVSAIWS